MNFISDNFIIFCLLFAIVFFVVGKSLQKFMLIAAGIGFCAIHSVGFAAALLFSVGMNYGLSHLVSGSSRKSYIVLGVTLNAGFLFVFKYTGFFLSAMTDGLHFFGMNFSTSFVKIAFPLGISFYTLQAISYQVDLWSGKVQRAALIDLATYLCFWPKLIAGPIIRAGLLFPQLAKARRFRWANFYLGIELVIYGVFLKTVLADRLAPHVARVYGAPAAFDGADTMLAVLYFTFQIYGDFAGYSLVVIGISRILGFSIKPNFRRPFFARSFTDFWSRWHISLSQWLRDYIFIRLPVYRGSVGTGSWQSVKHIYEDLLGERGLPGTKSFADLAGDSLSYVQISLALEAYLGFLPNNWESKSIENLELSKADAASFLS